MTHLPWLGETKYPTAAVSKLYQVTLGKMLQTSPSSATDIEVSYANSATVQWGGVSVSDMTTMWASQREAQFLSLKRGDLLVCEGGDVGRCAFVTADDHAIFQNSVHRIRSRYDSDVRYLYYVMQALHASEFLDVLTNKATIRHLTGEKFGSLVIPSPPFEEQRRIADFLDDETSRIDNVRASIQRATSLIEERRVAAVDELFASGGRFSTTRQTVRQPLRRVVEKWIDYRGATPEKVEFGVPLVTAGNIKDGSIDFDRGREYISSSQYHIWMRRGLPRVGDVLLTTEAPLGEIAMVSDPGIALAQRIILLRVNPVLVNPIWVYLYFRSSVGMFELSLRATGSTALGIKADRLRGVPIPIPAREDAEIRIAWLKKVSGKLDDVAQLRSRQLDLLVERRQALITAAVTGQLDVTTARSGVRV